MVKTAGHGLFSKIDTGYIITILLNQIYIKNTATKYILPASVKWFLVLNKCKFHARSKNTLLTKVFKNNF